MPDYIVNMRVDSLKPNPINSEIYDDNQSALNDLKESIQQNGLLEPITIDESDMVISGHRRLSALKMIGIKNVDCRLTKFENTTLATVLLNKYRQKTNREINNEIQILESEYKKEIPQGRPLKGEVRKLSYSSIKKVADSLGISQTKVKKLKSIGRYEPQLLQKIDMGVISVQKAYNYVMAKYKHKDADGKYSEQHFKTALKRLLKKYNPPKQMTQKIVRDFYND